MSMNLTHLTQDRFSRGLRKAAMLEAKPTPETVASLFARDLKPNRLDAILFTLENIRYKLT